MNAADTNAQQTKYYSPTVSGYVLKNSSDSYVTYAMMDKSFPASHYVRQGSATVIMSKDLRLYRAST